MSIMAKESLVDQFEERVGEYLTGAHTKKAVADLKETLEGYDVESVGSDYKAEDDDILKAFIDAKTVEGRSEKTINRYAYMLEKFINSVGVPTNKIAPEHIRAYMAAEMERGQSGRSIEGIRQIVSSFFGWACKEGLLKKNPMANIGAVKYKKEIKLPFSELEMAIIKLHCLDKRERAIIYFLEATGCRVSEVCGLKRDSVDYQKREVKVLGKGNKERIVYLNEPATVMVQEYINSRKDDHDGLFVGQNGNLTPSGLRNILKLIEKRSGVENVHPHRFRRTLATKLIDRGMPIQEVAFLLGHSNINTTMTYVFVDKINVKNAYDKYA